MRLLGGGGLVPGPCLVFNMLPRGSAPCFSEVGGDSKKELMGTGS